MTKKIGSDRRIYLRAKKQFSSPEGKIVGVLVFALAIVAWWMQGVVRALLGGLALYFFLMALSEISSRFERKKLVLSVETGENDGRFADEDEVRSSRQRTIPVFSSGAQTIRGQEAWPISRINGFGL